MLSKLCPEKLAHLTKYMRPLAHSSYPLSPVNPSPSTLPSLFFCKKEQERERERESPLEVCLVIFFPLYALLLLLLLLPLLLKYKENINLCTPARTSFLPSRLLRGKNYNCLCKLSLSLSLSLVLPAFLRLQ